MILVSYYAEMGMWIISWPTGAWQAAASCQIAVDRVCGWIAEHGSVIVTVEPQ
jgi:hypothetical protein